MVTGGYALGLATHEKQPAGFFGAELALVFAVPETAAGIRIVDFLVGLLLLAGLFPVNGVAFVPPSTIAGFGGSAAELTTGLGFSLISFD